MTTDTSKIESKNALQLVTDLCAWGVILLAGLALLGWLTGLRLLASVLADYIPMAISTAISFIVIGSLLLMRRQAWAVKHNFFFATISALLTVFHFLNLLSHWLSNGSVTVDTFLFPTNELVQSFLVNRMSPIASATFFISALALYLLFRAQASGGTARGADLLGFVVIEVGAISSLGYLYGTPLLYGGYTIPLALTTTLAFLLLGAGLIAASGDNNIILRLFSGPSLRARLSRMFLPISILLILAQGYLHQILHRININPVLWDGLISVVFALLMSIVIDLAARVLAQSIDRTQAERQKADEHLRESEARYRVLIEASPEAIVQSDLTGKILKCNRQTFQMLGYKHEPDLVGKRIIELVAPEERERATQNIRTAIRSGIGESNEYTGITANGTRFAVEVRSAVIADSLGQPSSVISIVRDITERKRTEEELRKLSQKDEEALRVARMGHWEFDLSTKQFIFNDQYYSLHGTTAEEAGGYSISAENFASKYVHPDDAHLVGESIQQGLETNDPNFQIQTEARILRADGEPRDVTVWFRIEKDPQDQTIKLHGVNQDITERKRAEKTLQRQTKELSAIYESARRLQQLRAPDALAGEIIFSLEHILNYTFGAILIIEEGTRRLLPFSVSDQGHNGSFSSIDAAYISSREPRVGKGITGWVAQSGEAICLGDVTKDSRYFSVRQDIRSELCVPLYVNEKIIGVVNVESIQLNAFDESDQRVLETVAAQIAVAIQNSRLYEQAQQEIAERKKVEGALRENQSHLQLIMDHMPVACILNDADTRVIYWNKAAEKIFGYTAEEMLGKVSSRLISLTALNIVDAIYQRIAAGDKHTHNTNENITKDGRIILCEWVNAPIQDEQGNFIGFLSMAQDVTGRKKAEAQLRKLSIAVEQSPASIVITNTRGEIEYVNPKFKDLTGYTAAEIIGQNSRLLKSGRTSDDDYKKLWTTISHGGEWRGKFLNKKKNGELYWESASISPIVNEAGEITHYLAVKEDITEREHREQELEAIAAISLALRAAPTRKEMLPIILDQLHSLFHSDGEAISMIDPFSNDLVVELGRGAFAATVGIRLPAGQGVSGLVIQSGQPYLSNDALHDPNFVRHDILQGINAFACVPLSTHDTTLGILWIGRAAHITPTDVRVLAAIADIAANAIQRAALHEQTKKQLEHLTALRTIDAAISNSFDMRVTLNIFLEQVISQLNVHAASILIRKSELTLEYAAGSGFRNRGIVKSHIRVGESHAGRAALERRAIIIPDLGKEPFAPSSALSAEGFVSYYGVPLIAKGQLKGVLQIFHRAPLSPDEEWLDFLQALAGQAAIAIDNAAMFDNLQRANSELLVAYNATIEGWSRALDLRDQETEGHTQRVTEMALNLAIAMSVEESQLIHLQRGALLHDIGKMGVSDSILLKPGPLSEEEMTIMRRHPQYAFDMLSPIPFLRSALDVPLCHHEKWDGTGYPRKLKGEQIPLVARIFAVADVWDAVTSDRPYRTAWMRDQAVTYIREQSGKHFEPRVVEEFLKMIET